MGELLRSSARTTAALHLGIQHSQDNLEPVMNFRASKNRILLGNAFYNIQRQIIRTCANAAMVAEQANSSIFCGHSL